ncbi:MAG: bifunctional 5,10-methylene-tetrahydrofolate dehydrogenase/5,10-methylene-tetrahydrofolate cyclohydrolase, partial [Eggerthellaceae bacterium]|nr:bifunctional 5,10-methylene-tetrahydrofolate dehydrogenase/5,10-methylene-tetrahydrofolate cyclohydrolase [Eggerthellaceae bacterium]
MAELLKGKPVADAINVELAPRIEACKAAGVTPTLAIIRVGEREDDLSYERGATKRCETLGLDLRKFLLPADCTQEELMAAIAAVNEDPAIHGCLMFRPLPKHLDEAAACGALAPEKDVDGITQGSLFGVFANRPIGFPPCTADACMQVLRHYGYDLTGAKVAVVGRSLVIGKPVSMMLQAANATVTMCHTRTKDLPGTCREADILVVAAGHIGTVGAD